MSDRRKELSLNTRIGSLVCAGAFCLIASETLLTFGALAQITAAGIAGASSVGSGSVATVRLVAEILPGAKQDSAERSARSVRMCAKDRRPGPAGQDAKARLARVQARLMSSALEAVPLV
jgi:hypothetical protein